MNGPPVRTWSAPFPASPRRAIRRGIRLACTAAGVIGALALTAVPARAGTITVTRTPSGGPVPAGFVGISTETRDLEAFTGTDPKSIDPAFLRLFGQIAPGQRPVLRIGGDSTDATWYPVAHQSKPPGVDYTITPRWLQVARATAQALDGKLILGVNLEAASKPDAVGEADAFLHQIGSRYIDAVEIGNEPELYRHFPWYHRAPHEPVYARTASWTPATYRTQFNAFAHAMPKVPLAGPVDGLVEGGGTWIQQLGAFLSAEPFVALTTIHAYPLVHCAGGHTVTIPELLADSASDGFVAGVAPYVRIAEAHHKPIRIDEVNAISCGGMPKVSDSFASALWMMNTLFGLVHTGVGGINVHMTPGAINAILNPVGSGSSRAIAVQPEYYAMIMFAQAAPPGARILHLQDAGLAPTEQAWATRDESGTVRVVLINKSASAATTTSLHVAGARGPASVESLRAANLAATEGVTLGGQSFGTATKTGELTGTPQQQAITPTGGAYRVTVPAASVTMLTLRPPAGALLVSAVTGGQLLAPLMSSW